jgi:hypothetical protein
MKHIEFLKKVKITGPYPAWLHVSFPAFRVVIGGVIAVATRAVFKPLSYLTACYLLNADAAKLKEEANDINNKKKLAAELSYKVPYCSSSVCSFKLRESYG